MKHEDLDVCYSRCVPRNDEKFGMALTDNVTPTPVSLLAVRIQQNFAPWRCIRKTFPWLWNEYSAHKNATALLSKRQKPAKASLTTRNVRIWLRQILCISCSVLLDVGGFVVVAADAGTPTLIHPAVQSVDATFVLSIDHRHYEPIIPRKLKKRRRHKNELKLVLSSSYRIAFMGNSILYYNDSPRIVQQMMMSLSGIGDVQQNSCLRGSATLTSLWEDGNGVGKLFQTPPALVIGESTTSTDPTVIDLVASYDIGAPTVKELIQQYNSDSDYETGWDFLILNDFTQGPARNRTMNPSINTIKTKLAPLLIQKTSDLSVRRITVPIIIQTQAYRVAGISGSSDLGDFDSFTNKIAAGVQRYAEAFNAVFATSSLPIARVAPVGEAYRYLRNNNRTLYDKLYSWDNVHPSPYGTYLQACVIFIACFPGTKPPSYDSNWWAKSRYTMPLPSRKIAYQVQFPDSTEAQELNRIAILVCDTNN